MSSYDDDSFDAAAYSTSAWDLIIQRLPDGVKYWVRRTVTVCKNLSFKAVT
jgi:hypothetical protein